jgi:hypothetical protein
MSFNRMSWGVKTSFRKYVEDMGGSVDLSDGATRAFDGSFVFMALPGGDLAIASDGSATGAMRFQGSITFEAHGGMLKATLTELGVEVGTDGLVLTALEAPLNRNRCTIAKLGVIEISQDDAVTLSAQITLDGMYQIADNYPPGTELDPLRLDWTG